MRELTIELLSRVRGIWRYRWYGVAAAWLVAIAGWVIVGQWPNRYEASARVYVDTQSVLRPLLAGLAVQPNLDQMVTMMSRTLISRPNVEKVIRMSDMDVKVNSPTQREQLVTRLTKEVTIKSAGAENLYTIAYSDSDGAEAKRVVQSLLSIFVEGSLGNKRKDSESAQRFINEQLKAYSAKLNTAENAVAEFKRRHMELMGNGQNYYTQLGEVQAALDQAALDLKEAENSRDAIKRQLAGESLPDLLPDSSSDAPTVSEIDSRIQSLQDKLDDLRLNYTEQHPDIIGINRMIAQLKEQKEREAKLRKPLPVRAQPKNLLVQQLTVTLAEAEATVASMKARVGEYGRRYGALKAKANLVPQVAAEYTQLTRDYETTKKNYDSLLSRLESAQISGNMETAGVMDFRVIDPPQVPATPVSPNRPLLASLVLLLALAAGLGFALVMSETNPIVFDERRLREVSGVPVFGTVVAVRTASQDAQRRKSLVALALSFLGLLSAYGAIIAIVTVRT